METDMYKSWTRWAQLPK